VGRGKAGGLYYSFVPRGEGSRWFGLDGAEGSDAMPAVES
jgi:hypothetical protein